MAKKTQAQPTVEKVTWDKESDAQPNSIAKYTKLLGAVAYDHEAAEQLADALNEITALELRADQLRQIVNENNDLHQFVWRTADGISMAIHTIDNAHLQNIMLHNLRNGRGISRAIRGEAIKRGLTIPVSVPVDWDETNYLETRRMQLENKMYNRGNVK